MNTREAFEALLRGERVRGKDWRGGDWIQLDEHGGLRDESGDPCWVREWEIVKETISFTDAMKRFARGVDVAPVGVSCYEWSLHKLTDEQIDGPWEEVK